jgi:hypothetical protein
MRNLEQTIPQEGVFIEGAKLIQRGKNLPTDSSGSWYSHQAHWPAAINSSLKTLWSSRFITESRWQILQLVAYLYLER